MHNGVVS